jgi:hypothetical protein
MRAYEYTSLPSLSAYWLSRDMSLGRSDLSKSDSEPFHRTLELKSF